MCWSSLGKTRSPPVKIMPSEKRGPTCTKLNTLLRTEPRQIIPLFRTERTKPIPYTLSNPLFSLKHSLCLVRSWCNNWLSVALALPWVRLTTHRTVTWISSISVSFWKSKRHFRNQTRQILEIDSVIWEIKRDKFWKSKVSFEKSNAANFGNRTRHILKSNSSNFGNQKCIWQIKRDKLWKSKLLLEKWNATIKTRGFFLLIIDKISKS